MRSWMLLALVACALGCAKKSPGSYEEAYPMAPPPPPPPASAPASDMPTGRSYPSNATTTASTKSASKARSRADSSGAAPRSTPTSAPSPVSAPEAPQETTPVAEEAQQRMIHYSGYANLKVARPDVLLADVEKLAVSLGGHVERLDTSQITIRVPVARFDEAFSAVLRLGDVIQKAITAEDITDAFTAVDLRLKTARMTRDRLVALLAMAKDEKEKLALLAQIRRLTEDIDVMESQLRTLAALADFSRITVVATARPAFADRTGQDDPVGFQWISQLSPFRRDVGHSGKLLKLTVPEGLVALDDKRHFAAESADHAAIWTGRLKNEPGGDAAFWIAAVKERLAPGFAQAEVSTVGAYQVLRLVSATDPAYRYLVGIHTDGDHLDLVEVYYPSAAQEERFGKAVLAALAGGQS